MKSKSRAFTLIELLVVVAIIALLIAILLPSLGKAKRMAVSANCLSNLRQCAMGMNMYANDFDGFIPYPTTTLGENVLWFNAIDPYLEAMANTARSGVAGGRSYQKYKQCPILSPILGDKTNYGTQGSAGQNTTTEYCRSYKENSMLRHNNSINPLTGAQGYAQARYVGIPNPSVMVALGDGMAMDITGSYPSQYDNGQFSMEVNEVSSSASCPALRHDDNSANISFLDGHAEHVGITSFASTLLSAPNTKIYRWHSEYMTNTGTDYNPGAGAHSLPSNVIRNPAMPLIWSDFENNLYR